MPDSAPIGCRLGRHRFSGPPAPYAIVDRAHRMHGESYRVSQSCSACGFVDIWLTAPKRLPRGVFRADNIVIHEQRNPHPGPKPYAPMGMQVGRY